jgi:hypothetical protein
MRYKSGIMVSAISIFEAFEFVASITAFDYVTIVENPGTINSLLGLSLTKLRH